jgi:flagellar biosynthesis/type III secretory pathway M-ring protein FliF/YscJ
MANITVVSKIRFIAGLMAVVLLVASPLMALAFLEFGNMPSDIKEEQVNAFKYAEAADSALYKMEWGRFQPDGVQIIVDQQRRFADVLDSAAHHLYTDQQRTRLDALANEAKPTLDAFRHADPHDDVMIAKMRDLHTMVSDLENADDAALEEYSNAVKNRAHELVAVVVIAGVIVPMICFALIWQLSADVRADLRAMRTEVENVADLPIAKETAIARMIEVFDQALTRLGFPKPNPMLADE